MLALSQAQTYLDILALGFSLGVLEPGSQLDSAHRALTPGRLGEGKGVVPSYMFALPAFTQIISFNLQSVCFGTPNISWAVPTSQKCVSKSIEDLLQASRP